MDARTVRQTIIKPKLTEVLGAAIASIIVTKATSAGMAAGSEREKLERMLDVICSDPRVSGMWGAAQTAKQKREWLQSIK